LARTNARYGALDDAINCSGIRRFRPMLLRWGRNCSIPCGFTWCYRSSRRRSRGCGMRVGRRTASTCPRYRCTGISCLRRCKAIVARCHLIRARTP